MEMVIKYQPIKIILQGGGGPTIEMIERLKRVENIDGIPKVESATPKSFFDTMKNDHKEKNLCTWNGELV